MLIIQKTSFRCGEPQMETIYTIQPSQLISFIKEHTEDMEILDYDDDESDELLSTCEKNGKWAYSYKLISSSVLNPIDIKFLEFYKKFVGIYIKGLAVSYKGLFIEHSSLNICPNTKNNENFFNYKLKLFGSDFNDDILNIPDIILVDKDSIEKFISEISTLYNLK